MHEKKRDVFLVGRVLPSPEGPVRPKMKVFDGLPKIACRGKFCALAALIDHEMVGSD